MPASVCDRLHALGYSCCMYQPAGLSRISLPALRRPNGDKNWTWFAPAKAGKNVSTLCVLPAAALQSCTDQSCCLQLVDFYREEGALPKPAQPKGKDTLQVRRALLQNETEGSCSQAARCAADRVARRGISELLQHVGHRAAQIVVGNRTAGYRMFLDLPEFLDQCNAWTPSPPYKRTRCLALTFSPHNFLEDLAVLQQTDILVGRVTRFGRGSARLPCAERHARGWNAGSAAPMTCRGHSASRVACR